MDRIKSLIEKLNMQSEQNAALGQLLTTVQMLQNEIAGTIKEVEVLGTSRISVIVPNAQPIPGKSTSNENIAPDEEEKEYFELVVDVMDEEDQEISTTSDIPSYEELMKLKNEQDQQQATLNFEQADDLPTLSRQNKPVVKAVKQSASPRAGKNAVKDLKKAINAQDKIAYVKELFRGDEVMFERSISTINNFSTLNEAEYWIQRELKTKNGWLIGHPVVQQFEQLIKRRFA
ncbi:hypothetical protein [Niabella aquatica]